MTSMKFKNDGDKSWVKLLASTWERLIPVYQF